MPQARFHTATPMCVVFCGGSFLLPLLLDGGNRVGSQLGCTTSIKLFCLDFYYHHYQIGVGVGSGWGLGVHLLYICFVCTFYTLILPLSYWVYAVGVGLLWGLPHIGVKTNTCIYVVWVFYA